MKSILFTIVGVGLVLSLGLHDRAWSAAEILPVEQHRTGEQSIKKPQVLSIPPGTVFERVHVDPDGPVAAPATAAGEDERLIYSNTLGVYFAGFPSNLLVSDEVSTTAPDGCHLTRFRFRVMGKVNPTGTGGGYTVRYSLYNVCPQAVTPVQRTHYTDEPLPDTGIKIRGTDGEITFPDDAPREIEHFVTLPEGVTIPASVWLGVSFTRSNCGVVLGAPAEIGFSSDNFDFPGLACNGSLGGFPYQPQASFWFQVNGGSNCPESFVGYKTSRASGSSFNAGSYVPFLDDVHLIVDDCRMIAYEVAVRGQGYYKFDLSRNCERPLPTDGPWTNGIPGTYRTFSVNLNTQPQLQLARFSFDPPIPLGTSEVFFRFAVNNATGGVVLAGIQPAIGASSEYYYLIDPSGQCTPQIPPSPLVGIFHTSITCAGSLPAGACCDMAITDENGDAVCREVPQMNCPWPWPPFDSTDQPSWVEGATCDSDPFPLPCGVAACCLPDDTCENLTESDCQKHIGVGANIIWQQGVYCGDPGQSCPRFACLQPFYGCLLAHNIPGCADSYCCNSICEADPWCCDVEWDRVCVDEAAQLCTTSAINDHCYSSSPLRSAQPLEQHQPVYFTNVSAKQDNTDPGFCCNADAPGATGYGSVWFKFVATDVSAQIDTCQSDPEGDSLVNVFAVGDPTSESTSCHSLSLIGCGDDGCSSSGRHSKFCVDGLTPGQTYYIMLASKTAEAKGTHQLELKSPCPSVISGSFGVGGKASGTQAAKEWNSGGLIHAVAVGEATDCNENNVIDLCDLAFRDSFDCNENGVPDECDEEYTITPDCNNTGVPDACDIIERRSDDCQGNGIPDECDIAAKTSADCDGNGVPDECFALEQTLAPQGVHFVTEGRTPFAATSSLLAVGVSGGLHQPGAVAVYSRQNSELVFESRITPEPDSPLEGGTFGDSIGLSPGHLSVSARFSNAGPYTGAGNVFVFHRERERWIQEAMVTADIPQPHDGFGEALAMKGDRFVAGAPNVGTGAAYVFKRAPTGWIRESKLEPGPYAFLSFFGSSVAMDEETIVVGAINDQGGPGAAYVYRLLGDQWVFEGKLESPDQVHVRRFGRAVAVANDLIAITGDRTQMSTMFDAAVHLFRRTTSGWTLDLILAPPNGEVGSYDHFLSLEGNILLVSGPRTSPSPPVTSAFRRDPTGWTRLPSFRSFSASVNGAFGGSSDINLPWAVISTAQNWPSALELPKLGVFAIGASDCNSNGISDVCEIQDGFTVDCNANGTPDDCELAASNENDCNGNSIHDACDILDGNSFDCQPNDRPDECDISDGESLDCDADGVPDDCALYRQTLAAVPPTRGFGYAIATAGDQLLIGDPSTPVDNLQEAGAVHVYRRSAGLWVEDKVLTAPSPEDYSGFGTSVSVNGNQALVVAWGGGSGDNRIAGDVFDFERKGDHWVLRGLLPSVAALSEYAPHWMQARLGLDYAVVAAYTWNGIGCGGAIVYSFRRTGATWTLEGALNNGTGFSSCSFDIAMAGDFLALVSSSTNIDGEFSDPPVAHIFRRTPSGWRLGASLSPPSAKSLSSVALRDGLLLIGGVKIVAELGRNINVGYLYRLKGSVWTLEAEILDPDAIPADWTRGASLFHGGLATLSAPDRTKHQLRAKLYLRMSSGMWGDAGALWGPAGGTGIEWLSITGTPEFGVFGWSLWQGADPPGSGSLFTFALPTLDCNANDISDSCELRDGLAEDCNHDFTPDECNARTHADYDFSGSVDLRDLAAFQRCFTGTVGPIAPCCGIFDATPTDDLLDLKDVNDLQSAWTGP